MLMSTYLPVRKYMCVIHELVEHHCAVGVDHSIIKHLQLGLREHRTAVGVCITGVDVSIVQEAVHPLHDCRGGRPLRETAFNDGLPGN